MHYVFMKRLVKENIEELFSLLDEDQKGYLTLDNFFNLIDLIENNRDIARPEVIENKAWNKVRDMINKIFKFDVIATNKWFDAFMVLVVLFNCGILIAYSFATNQDVLDTLDNIDNYLVWIYLGEVIIKLLGLGINPYFRNGWNV
jgi:Ion transport protein